MRLVSTLSLAALFAVASHSALATQWSVDTRRSHLGFTVKWSGEPFIATFKSWSARVDFDPHDLAHAHVAADVTLASESSDTPDNDEGLKGSEGFAIGRFPTAHFEASRFTFRGGDRYIASGMLSLHGVQKSVDLPFTLAIAGNTARAIGKVTLSRMAFGLGSGEWAGPDPIAYDVVVDVDLTATKVP